MIEMYKTVDNHVKQLEKFEDGAWLNVTAPTTEDIQELKEANVIGYVPSYAHDLVKLLKPGSKFSFKIVKE